MPDDVVHVPLPHVRADERQLFEEMGIIFGESTPGDPRLCRCTVPGGWQLVPADGGSPRWSYLRDELGRARAAILTGQVSLLLPCARFKVRVTENLDTRRQQGSLYASVCDDAGHVLYTTQEFPVGETQPVTTQRGKAYDDAEGWASRHLEHWKNPLAYWSDSELPGQ